MLSADILGQVYEQFLGKVITLSAGHRAQVEDKPEVKKAGGVFYTPTYIVDYIVRQTIGSLIKDIEDYELKLGSKRIERIEERKQASGFGLGIEVTDDKMPKRTLDKVAQLRVLDPACGSGSFLIGAYQFLLDWHLGWYLRTGVSRWAKLKNPPIIHSAKGNWVLSLTERKRILLNNIFGVDIDSQAVEVTKLSLLLKVLEVEGTQAQKTLGLHDRVLPDLGENVKCGNSLIGSDFYAQPGLPAMDAEAHLRINVFDWDGKDGFPEIMKRGGFDAVIGNPPWGAEFSKPGLEYIKARNRDIIVRMIDSFMFFVNKALSILRPDGQIGMILPDVLFYQIDNQNLRHKLLTETTITHALNMGDVFENVTRPTSILIAKVRREHENLVQVADLTKTTKSEKPEALANSQIFETVVQQWLLALPGKMLVTSRLGDYSVYAKMIASPTITLAQMVDEDGIQRGVSPDLKEAFILTQDTADTWNIESTVLRDVITGGRHVRRYRIERPNLKLIYTSRDSDFAKLPNTRAYIDQFRKQITCKEVVDGKHSIYSLHRARDEGIFNKSAKLLGVITEDEIIVALDSSGVFASDGLYLFGVRPEYSLHFVMGVLNSHLFVFIYRLLAIESGRVLAQVKPTILNRLPIRVINPKNKTDQAAHDRIVKLVEQMLKLHQDRAIAKTPHEQTALDRQIAATDKQIDQEVYALYGLTAEEIDLVEGRSVAEPEPSAAADEPASQGSSDRTHDYHSAGGSTGHMVFREEHVEYKTQPS